MRYYWTGSYVDVDGPPNDVAINFKCLNKKTGEYLKNVSTLNKPSGMTKIFSNSGTEDTALFSLMFYTEDIEIKELVENGTLTLCQEVGLNYQGSPIYLNDAYAVKWGKRLSFAYVVQGKYNMPCFYVLSNSNGQGNTRYVKIPFIDLDLAVDIGPFTWKDIAPIGNIYQSLSTLKERADFVAEKVFEASEDERINLYPDWLRKD